MAYCDYFDRNWSFEKTSSNQLTMKLFAFNATLLIDCFYIDWSHFDELFIIDILLFATMKYAFVYTAIYCDVLIFVEWIPYIPIRLMGPYIINDLI